MELQSNSVLGSASDGLPITHVQTFAAVINSFNRTYFYTYDEAMKNSLENARAMRRDAYLRALMQERKTPTKALPWSIQVDNLKDSRQRMVQEGVTRAIKSIPRWRRLNSCLLEAIWYGRYGVQWTTGMVGGLRTITKHKPVNGDKIQYEWDDTPCVLLNSIEADRIRREDPNAIVQSAGGRGGPGLRLYRPYWRDRFAIHQYDVDDADYFDAEMAGGVHGVGLRHWCYWAYWLRQEVTTWMLSFMDGVGMMDMLIFNYEEGNLQAQQAAEANAKKITGKISIIMPRPREFFQRGGPAVETIQVNVQGMESLKSLIQDHFEKHIERLFVGQSMSAGEDKQGSLGGTGRANFAENTKQVLLEDDSSNRDETVTLDIVAKIVKWNFPWADFPVRYKSSIKDPDAEIKTGNLKTFYDMKLPVKKDEGYAAAGFSVPIEGDDVILNEEPEQPGIDDEGGRASGEEGDDFEDDDDVMDRLHRIDDMILYRKLYASQWESHVIEKGPRKGKTVYVHKTTGVTRDTPPDASEGGRKGIVGRTKAKAASVGGAIKEKLNKTSGGRAILKIGGKAVKAAVYIEHKASIIQYKTRDVAKEAAKLRGLSEEQTDRLGKMLAAGDFIGSFASGGATLAAAHAVGLPMLAGKIGGVMPTASVAYLLYSTARDPIATWKAAKKVVSDTFSGKSKAEHYCKRCNEKDLASNLAAWIKDAKDSDWYSAVWHVAIATTHGDKELALQLAQETTAENPESPILESPMEA